MSVSSISMWDEDLFDSSSYFIDADGDEYSTQSMRLEEEDQEEKEEEEAGNEEECRKNAIAEIATTYTHIKNMNNVSATSLIRKGKYDKAIVKLDKALKILRPTDDITMNYFETETCNCNFCSLDGCIEYSEHLMKNHQKSSIGNRSLNKFLHLKKNVRRMIEKKKSPKTKKNGEEEKGDIDNHDSFHRTPICIPAQSIRENHNMGSTLFLIITFNLTLAHHLKVHEKQNQEQKQKRKKKPSSDDSSSSLLTLIKGTIQLYKILLKSINTKETDTMNDKSKERFINIVQNNMNHLIKNKNTAAAASSTKGKSVELVDNLSLHSEQQHPKASSIHRRPSTTDSSIALISLKENNNENFSSRVHNAIKTSFSFIQLQQKSVRCATAA